MTLEWLLIWFSTYTQTFIKRTTKLPSWFTKHKYSCQTLQQLFQVNQEHVLQETYRLRDSCKFWRLGLNKTLLQKDTFKQLIEWPLLVQELNTSFLESNFSLIELIGKWIKSCCLIAFQVNRELRQRRFRRHILWCLSCFQK